MNPSSSPLSIVLADCADSVTVERAIWELATRLPRERFDVRVWLSSDPAKEPFAAALAASGVAVDRMPTAGAAWGFRRVFDVWGRLRRARPALLHLHFAWPSDDGVPAAIAEIAGVKHRIVTAHGGRSPETTRAASRKTLEGADLVTTTCDGFAEQLVRETGIARDRIRRILPGIEARDDAREVELARRIRERLGAGVIRPLWVFAGRLEAHRGPGVLIEALGIVRERGLHFVAALMGRGPQALELERRIGELGLEASVTVIDPDDDLGALIAAADAVVVPSLWDGMSPVLLQALSRGRPVIASAVGGAPDVVENGATGRLVPPGDARALADALESFHRRGDSAARMGREAERRSGDEFNWERVVDAYEAVYDDVLGLASFVADRDAVARGRW
jgi:glycosyltransferase involved in cell wall biosynthesis